MRLQVDRISNTHVYLSLNEYFVSLETIAQALQSWAAAEGLSRSTMTDSVLSGSGGEESFLISRHTRQISERCFTCLQDRWLNPLFALWQFTKSLLMSMDIIHIETKVLGRLGFSITHVVSQDPSRVGQHPPQHVRCRITPFITILISLIPSSQLNPIVRCMSPLTPSHCTADTIGQRIILRYSTDNDSKKLYNEYPVGGSECTLPSKLQDRWSLSSRSSSIEMTSIARSFDFVCWDISWMLDVAISHPSALSE